MNQPPTDLVRRQTAVEIAAAYQTACEEIKAAHALLGAAAGRMNAACGFNTSDYDYRTFNSAVFNKQDGVDHTINEVRRMVWGEIVEKMGARSFMGIADASKLDAELRQADRGSRGTLPEITEETIFGMCAGFVSNLQEYTNNAIKEVFELLRPRRNDYKTNSMFEIGRRVILTWICEADGWSSHRRVRYHAEQKLRTLDHVFHLLDGQGVIKTHGGPLLDAMTSEEARKTNKGETAYFKFVMYRNGNLHLEFKRLDLVKELNRRAGGLNLRDDR